MSALSPDDLAVDRELADLAEGFRFLLDLTPVDLPDARALRSKRLARRRRFRYRDLEDDPALAAKRLAAVPVDQVADPTLASLLLAKHRELRLQLEMLECRGSTGFLALSIELYGAVGAELLAEAEAILEQVPDPGPEEGPWLDAAAVAKAAQAELDRYRAFAPDLESHVEVREGSTGVMVSNGDVLVAPTCHVPVGRLEALLHHEVGTHVVTHVNGAAQPLRVLASGLAGHDETQEGLAVLAEHLVGGLTARRLRQLAGRVVAVHAMVERAPFDEVHATLVAAWHPRPPGVLDHHEGVPGGRAHERRRVPPRSARAASTISAGGADLDVLWLGKMPLSAAPLVADLHDRGELRDAAAAAALPR